jgi:hypothetical protein
VAKEMIQRKRISHHNIIITDIIKPAIANHLGCFNIHIADNTNHNSHIIRQMIGIQLVNIAMRESTNPAIHNPLVSDVCVCMITV